MLTLAVPFFWRLEAEEFHGDESHWITSGQQAFHLFTSGQVAHPQWREEFYLYSQPQVGKLLIGAALAAGGYAGPVEIYDYDWQLRPAANRAVGRVPADGAVVAARVPGAVAGWLACLLLWSLAAALGWPAAGRLGAVLLASHPLWLANARRAGLDASALCLGLVAAWAAVRAVRALARSDGSGGTRSALLWALLAGTALGLAAGTKYVGPLAALPAAAAAPIWARRGGPNQAWRGPGGAALAAATTAAGAAAVVFVAANPTLYADPVEQLRVSAGFLARQAADMRHQHPVFAAPPLVAAEIFDRTIWPTGFPRVVDRTLPEPLVPGSYGTPVVALGAAAALATGLRWSGPARTVLGAALAWAAVVYAALILSLPIWWERWHLPLVPPLCLLAGAGLAALRESPEVRGLKPALERSKWSEVAAPPPPRIPTSRLRAWSFRLRTRGLVRNSHDPAREGPQEWSAQTGSQNPGLGGRQRRSPVSLWERVLVGAAARIAVGRSPHPAASLRRFPRAGPRGPRHQQGERGAAFVAIDLGFLLAAAQVVAALAMGPSYLGRGFAALLATPAGAAAHLVALGLTLAALVAGLAGRYPLLVDTRHPHH